MNELEEVGTRPTSPWHTFIPNCTLRGTSARTTQPSRTSLSRRRWCCVCLARPVLLTSLPLCCYPFLALASILLTNAYHRLLHPVSHLHQLPIQYIAIAIGAVRRSASLPEACSLGHDSFACADDDHHQHTHSQEWLPSEKTCSVWSTSCRTWSSTPSAMILWISRRLFVPPSRPSEDIDHALTLHQGQCRLAILWKILRPRGHCWP